MTELPSVSDWREADAPAQELTDRIMRGMDCVNPSVFEQHVKAVLTAYIAQEAAERREYASRAFSSPKRAESEYDGPPYWPLPEYDARRRVYHTPAGEGERPEDFFREARDPGPTDDEILGWNEANEYLNERPDDEG